jgi:predicted RNA-binding protein associated with RNAse of E/G family
VPQQIYPGRRLVVDRLGEVSAVDEVVVTDVGLYVRYGISWHPAIRTIERWLLPSPGCAIIRWALRAEAEAVDHDWYIDFDRVVPTVDCWTVHDRYLDLTVREGRDYRVHDADELAEALESGLIDMDEAAAAMRALQDVCGALGANGMSVRAYLAKRAPGLPV